MDHPGAGMGVLVVSIGKPINYVWHEWHKNLMNPDAMIEPPRCHLSLAQHGVQDILEIL